MPICLPIANIVKPKKKKKQGEVQAHVPVHVESNVRAGEEYQGEATQNDN
jgi:hypothetical protein